MSRSSTAAMGRWWDRVGEGLKAGLVQWPVVGAIGGLHFAGLLSAFLMLTPSGLPSWGARAALLLFLAFVVLLEVCLAVGIVGLLESLASTLPRARVLDIAKSTVLAALLSLVAASLLKLAFTGSHLTRLDLWFLFTNLAQLTGESLGSEIGLALGLLAMFGLAAFVVFRAFRTARHRAADTPMRSLLILTILSLLGVTYTAARYPQATAFGRLVAPELGWILGETPGAPPSLASGGDSLTLGGPPIEPYEPTGPAERPNVLLVMLESVPWNIIELDKAVEAIPNLLALSEQSVTFSRAYAPSVHSDYAQMAVLSSLHPRKYDHHDYYEQIEYPRTLIWDALAPAGWTTAMFSCQNEGWGNMIHYLRTPGLEVFRHSPDWPTAPHRGRGSESKVFEATVVDAWQSWLESEGESPWFAYLNFQATHFPYEAPMQATRPFAPYEIDFPASFIRYPLDKVSVMRNRYLNALHYSDRYLGEIVRVLEERGDWERTILVVVSDHGEAFYEHGQPTHGTQLFEEQIRSLMMVRLPGEPSRIVDQAVSLLDLAPALIDHLGLPPHGNFQGRSDIFAPDYSARGRPFLFTIQGLTDEDGLLLDDWKYTVNWRTGTRQLYHVASDPFERDDLAGSDPARTEQLNQSLGQLLSRQLAYYSQRGWQSDLYAEALP